MPSSPFNKVLKRVLKEQPPTFMDSVFYTNPNLVPLESRYIFQESWIYVGHSKKLTEPGAVMATNVAGHSLLIIRNKHGKLQAFKNICTHRNALLQTEVGVKNLKCITCPYHGWTFDLDGNLKAMPGRECFAETIDAKKLSLQSIRLETWGPFMFISLGKDVPPLKEYLGQNLAQLTGNFPLQQLSLLYEQDYPVNCNWKVFHDNSLCDYHVNVVHRTTLKDVLGSTQNYNYVFDEYVNTLITPTTASLPFEGQCEEELPEQNKENLTFGIFPNLHIYSLPDGELLVERIDPVTVNTCQVHVEIYGIPGHVPPLDELLKWYEQLFNEDLKITESVQKGYQTGSFAAGPINLYEARVIHQQQLIRRFLLGGLASMMKQPVRSTYSDFFERSSMYEHLGNNTRRPPLLTDYLSTRPS